MEMTFSQTAANLAHIPLDFDTLVKEVNDLLDRHPCMVLATCDGDRVTARSMSIIHHGLTILFQTGSDSLKYSQITANANVALCAANLQIEGTARDLGHPLAPQNQYFATNYAAKHPGSFNTYSTLVSNHVIEVTLRRATLWKYDAQHLPYRDFLEIGSGQAWREIYPLDDKIVK